MIGDARMPAPGNRYLNGAITVVLGGFGLVLCELARLDAWLADRRLVRAEARAERHERRMDAWESIGCIEEDS